MASCANGTKYKKCCDDLDLNSRYVNKDDPALMQFNPFELTQEHWSKKVASYNMQDTKAGRDIKDNVKEDNFEYFREMIQGSQCWFCEVRFTNKNPPTLDRIDNNLEHSKSNVQLACSWCNVKRGNRDPYITKGLIQLKRYYLAKCLPMPLTDEETYHKLRPNITGGLANAFHRYNIKDETHINKLKFEGQYVVSYDLDYIMTQFCGYDFNSLYPSVMSGIPHDFIKYTGKRIYMSGYEQDRIECDSDSQKELDSMMLAVAGDPKQNYQQGFSAVIKDKQFYDQNFYKFFPKPMSVVTIENKPQLEKIDEGKRKLKIKELQIQDEKKPLGVAYEHCGSTLIALAPKNYWLRQEFDKKDP
ncbi:MAG: hypothetical protein EZS28_030695, partial [Streblomastix strix]